MSCVVISSRATSSPFGAMPGLPQLRRTPQRSRKNRYPSPIIMRETTMRRAMPLPEKNRMPKLGEVVGMVMLVDMVVNQW